MALDPTLLSILACPQDKGPLLLIDDELLYNPRLRRAYPIEDGIPVLLVDEARDVSEDEHESLLARAEGSAGA
ncbi:Trm112 family protein [Rhodococcus sp. NPDC059234]|uniref:Trm112 family protein n=1 Tax=Rhodococcus sp. NPDC059234 TaxID=3346781 RepID=UPI00366A8730